MKNVYYIDNTTKSFKIGVHANFDEGHFTVSRENAPLVGLALQIFGYTKPNDICKGGNLSIITRQTLYY